MRLLNKQIALGLVGILIISMLGGCKEETVEVPELIEPSAVRESYRPVERGDIGKMDIVYGEVTPTEHCYFWSIATTINELNVQLGDYVEVGDILASSDPSEANEAISSLQQKINCENEVMAVEEESYTYKHKELEYASASAYESNNTTQVEEVAKSIALLEENHKFEVMLHEYNKEQYQDEIDENRKLIDEVKLVADTAGYVTFTKDLTSSSRAGAYENVVIISDFNDRYIEVPTVNMTHQSRTQVTVYESFYTELDNKRYDLEEYEYSPEEVVIIENKAKYPNMRFKLTSDKELPEVGVTIPIYMLKDASKDVLFVMNESIYSDAGGEFVYVKKGESKELRYIEIGKRGDNYSEVISGLEEGELVNYTLTNMLPENYMEVTVESGDYNPIVSVRNYSVCGRIEQACYSDYEGVFTEVLANEKKSVKKGEVICRIKTGIGGAKLSDMANELTALTENYNLQIKGFEDARQGIYKMTQMTASMCSNEQAGLKEQLKNGKNPQGVALTPAQEDAIRKQIEVINKRYSYDFMQYEMQKNEIDCAERITEINYKYSKQQKETEYAKAKKDNDGAGIVTIYAQADGYMYAVNMKTGDEVKKNDRLFCILNNNKNIIALATLNTLRIDQQVKFVQGQDDDDPFIGKVIGISDPGRVYLNSVGNDTYISTNSVNSQLPVFFIEVNDPDFNINDGPMFLDYSRCSMQDVCLVPPGLVYGETIGDDNYEYVWRVDNGTLVKQYVIQIKEGAETVKYCVIYGLKPGDVIAMETN